MKFYVFLGGFGVLAGSEEEARATAREQWSEHFVGTPDDHPDNLKLLEAAEPGKIVPFFC